jgi:predicted DNA-binding transcriptional regulator YafY
MSRPIALSDDELSAIMNAAKPLQPADRDRFLRAVAEAITALPEIGPGSVHRAISELQRRYFVAPDLRVDEPRSPAYP